MSTFETPSPAEMIDYVLAETNQTGLYYFGHSQGTEMGFTGFSENQQLAKKVGTTG